MNIFTIIMCSAPTPEQLEQKMEQVLKVCRKKNMKLSPSKFQCARQVTFGGVNIEALKQRGDTETRVYLTPEDEKIQKFLDIEEPRTKKDAQMICGMAAQLKAWVPGLQLIYPNIQKLTSNTTPFTWSADLSLEFQAIHESIKLSPLDTNKKLYAFVESAVTVGTAYVLAQRKDENCEKTSFHVTPPH